MLFRCNGRLIEYSYAIHDDEKELKIVLNNSILYIEQFSS